MNLKNFATEFKAQAQTVKENAKSMGIPLTPDQWRKQAETVLAMRNAAQNLNPLSFPNKKELADVASKIINSQIKVPGSNILVSQDGRISYTPISPSLDAAPPPPPQDQSGGVTVSLAPDVTEARARLSEEDISRKLNELSQFKSELMQGRNLEVPKKHSSAPMPEKSFFEDNKGLIIGGTAAALFLILLLKK